MAWISALAPALAAGCMAFVSLSVSAQTAPADGKRQKVNVRAMVPGPQASDAVGEPRPAAGLTRDERKEATLQARKDGTLQPAGEAADQTQLAAAASAPAKKGKGKRARLAAGSSAPA